MVNMDVVSENGSLGVGTLRPATWDMGEVQICRKTQFSTTDWTGDLLMCGSDTLIAWEGLTDQEKQGWHAATTARRAKLRMVAGAKTFSVMLRGSGPVWRCRKTTDGLTCE
jgi:hypothetical protein